MQLCEAQVEFLALKHPSVHSDLGLSRILVSVWHLSVVLELGSIFTALHKKHNGTGVGGGMGGKQF